MACLQVDGCIYLNAVHFPVAMATSSTWATFGEEDEDASRLRELIQYNRESRLNYVRKRDIARSVRQTISHVYAAFSRSDSRT